MIYCIVALLALSLLDVNGFPFRFPGIQQVYATKVFVKKDGDVVPDSGSTSRLLVGSISQFGIKTVR
jgi:hypothetical protein